VSERTLVPEDNAKVGEIRFKDWLNQGPLKKELASVGGAGTRKAKA
jgi:hypothetical protein